MPTDLVIQAIGQLGFPVAIAVWFLWRDWTREKANARREEGLVKRLRELEEARIAEAHSLLREALEAIRNNTAAFQAMMHAATAQARALTSRPCFRNDTRTDDFTPHPETPQ